MSPGHALPTGMPSLEKPEHIPEIQMPSMAALDPDLLRGEQDGYNGKSTLFARGLAYIALRHAITDDIVQIYNGVQHCLDLRRKYIRTSLQRSYDNPKNNVDRWRIYPDPPKPRWTYNAEDNKWVDHKNDLPKLGGGEDFNFKECAIPGADSKTFRLDNGVYQVYPDDTSTRPSDLIADISCGTNCCCSDAERVLS